MDEIQWCYHSNETSSEVLSLNTIYILLSLWMKSSGVAIQMKPTSAVLSHGTIYLLVVLPFESVDEIVCCDHSNETSSAVISPFPLRFLILINFNLHMHCVTFSLAFCLWHL